jgi:polyferredoxin
METVRKLVQATWVFLTNGFWGFPWTAGIYQGPLKVICSPGLNCYSCPAATTYCPIGSLQQLLLGVRFSIQSGTYYFGAYVLGSMGILGALFGRFICGWVCPFGLFQELLHKIPSKKFSIPKSLNRLKYLVLLLLVIVLPLVIVDSFGMGKPWFCKYICPAGALEAGIPMVFLMPELRSTLGILYWNKMIILAGFTLWSILASRPFCRTTCPLGAFYALFHRYRLIRLHYREDACTKCGACHDVCPVEIHFNEEPDNVECVSCLRCMSKGCRFGAIGLEIGGFPIGTPSTQPVNVKKATTTEV